MNVPEVFFQPIRPSQNHHRDQDCGNTGVNGSYHEIGPEDGAVPHGPQCHCEDPANDGMHGHSYGDYHNSQNLDDALENHVLIRCIAVARRQKPVEAGRLDSRVTDYGQIR